MSKRIELFILMTIGIYKITCTANNRFYIGSSKVLEKRFSKHASQLKSGRHENIHMQRAYNKYGKNCFKYEVIKIVDVDTDLLTTEQKYLDSLNPSFNIGKQASGGDNLTNHPNRGDIIRRMSASMKKRMSNPVIKKHYSEMFTGDGNPNWKNNVVEQKTTCKCGGKKEYSAEMCMLCLDRTKDKNPFFGKKHSRKTKLILSKAKKGTLPSNAMAIRINGIEYRSQAEAARAIGVSPALITYRLNKGYEGYIRLTQAS